MYSSLGDIDFLREPVLAARCQFSWTLSLTKFARHFNVVQNTDESYLFGEYLKVSAGISLWS